MQNLAKNITSLIVFFFNIENWTQFIIVDPKSMYEHLYHLRGLCGAGYDNSEAFNFKIKIISHFLNDLKKNHFRSEKIYKLIK